MGNKNFEFNETIQTICETAKIKISKKDIKQIQTIYKNSYDLINAESFETINNKKIKEILPLIKKFAVLYEKIKLNDMVKIGSPRDVYNYLKAKIGSNRDEVFVCVFLNSANEIISIDEVSKGVVNKSSIYPRKIAELSLKYNATCVILAHNHPSGTNNPSNNDMIATEAITKALKVLDIAVLDHLIIARDTYYSFKDNGLI